MPNIYFPMAVWLTLLKKRFNIPYVITTHGELFYFKHFLARKIGHEGSAKVLPMSSQLIIHRIYISKKRV